MLKYRISDIVLSWLIFLVVVIAAQHSNHEFGQYDAYCQNLEIFKQHLNISSLSTLKALRDHLSENSAVSDHCLLNADDASLFNSSALHMSTLAFMYAEKDSMFKRGGL